MAEEKDAGEREAELAGGEELPPLPPIPRQLQPSNGQPRRGEHPAGLWCAENGVTPPPGSFDTVHSRPSLVVLPRREVNS
jgi:phospholipid/cholesterol/gamma-HCH transport system ATP-binding protein